MLLVSSSKSDRGQGQGQDEVLVDWIWDGVVRMEGVVRMDWAVMLWSLMLLVKSRSRVAIATARRQWLQLWCEGNQQ